jgi:hypothetical protein
MLQESLELRGVAPDRHALNRAPPVIQPVINMGRSGANAPAAVKPKATVKGGSVSHIILANGREPEDVAKERATLLPAPLETLGIKHSIHTSPPETESGKPGQNSTDTPEKITKVPGPKIP